MVTAKEEPAEMIERDMRAKRGRRSIVSAGGIKVILIPVGLDGHDGWKVRMPHGGRIDHETLTTTPENE
jgi:hypothetical protein